MIKLILSFSIPCLIFFLIIMKLNADNLPPDYKETIPNLDYSKSMSLPDIVRDRLIEVEDSVGGCLSVYKTNNGEYLLKCAGDTSYAIIVKYNRDFSPVFLTKVTLFDSISNTQIGSSRIAITNISESDSNYFLTGTFSTILTLGKIIHFEYLDKETGIIKNQFYNFQANNAIPQTYDLPFTDYMNNGLFSDGKDKFYHIGYSSCSVPGSDINVITNLKSFSTNAQLDKKIVLDSLNDEYTSSFLVYDTVSNVYDGLLLYTPGTDDSTLLGLTHLRFDENLNVLTKQTVPLENDYFPIKYTNFNNKHVLWGFYESVFAMSKNLDILEFTDNSDYSKFLTHHIEFNYTMSFTNVIKSRDGGYFLTGAITFFDDDSLSKIHGVEDNALIKLDKDFNLVWERFWGTSLDENLVWCDEQDNGNIYVVGNYFNYIASNPKKIYFAEIKNPSTSVDNDLVNKAQTEIIFPSIVSTTSPELKFTTKEILDCEVFISDLLGNCVQKQHINSSANNTNYLQLDFTSMIAGVYFIGIRTGNGLEVRKFIFAP